MENYLEIANSPGMWAACAAVVVVVIFQAIRFTVIAYSCGKKIGLTKQEMFLALRTGFTTALVPSVAVLLGLALLIPLMGVAFPWMRLSVLGSVTYELMASGMAASALDVKNISDDSTGVAFSTAVWVMSMGFIFPLCFVAFFTPKIESLKGKIAGGDDKWMEILSMAAFFGAVGYLIVQPVVEGGSARVALLGGFVSVAVLGAICTVGKQAWLKEWVISLSIIGGMAAAGTAYHYFGIGG